MEGIFKISISNNQIIGHLLSDDEIKEIGRKLALKNPHIGHKNYTENQFERDVALEFRRVSRFNLYGPIRR